MNPGMPRFLLFAETGPAAGAWRFVLRKLDGAVHFEAADVEPDIFGERLELLTVVRGLEALDQPSRVTLVGCTNYLRQAVQFGMPQWRTDDWLWERFGHMLPVKNADLWQRLDRLMAFHEVECRQRRIDGAHPVAERPTYLAPRREASANRMTAVAMAFVARAWNRLPLGFRQRMVACEGKRRQLALASRKAIRNSRMRLEDVLVPLLRLGTHGLEGSAFPQFEERTNS